MNPYRPDVCTPETCSAARRVQELEKEVEKLQKPSWWSRLWRKKPPPPPPPALPPGRADGELWHSGNMAFIVYKGYVFGRVDNYWHSVETGERVNSLVDGTLDRMMNQWNSKQDALKLANKMKAKLGEALSKE